MSDRKIIPAEILRAHLAETAHWDSVRPAASSDDRSAYEQAVHSICMQRCMILDALAAGRTVTVDEMPMLFRGIREGGACSDPAAAKRTFADTLEKLYALRKRDAHARQAVLYAAAYMLSGDRKFSVGGKTFSDYEALLEYLDQLLSESPEKYQAFCEKLF